MKKIILSTISLSLILTAVACGPKALSQEEFKEKGDKDYGKLSDDDKKLIDAELITLVSEKLDYSDLHKANQPKFMIDMQKNSLSLTNESCKNMLSMREETKTHLKGLGAKVKASEEQVKKQFGVIFKKGITPYQFGQCIEKLPEVAKVVEASLCEDVSKDSLEKVLKNAKAKYSDDTAMQDKCADSLSDFFDFAKKLPAASDKKEKGEKEGEAVAVPIKEGAAPQAGN